MVSHRIDKKQKSRIVSRMAQVMLDNQDHCTRDTLLLHFDPHEIDQYETEARGEARRGINREAA